MSITDQLLDLYRVERQLRSLSSRVDQARRYRDGQIRQVEELKRQRQGLESQRRQLSAAAHNLENDVSSADDRISRLRDQMNNAQTNKEYTALRTELSTVKIEKDKLESEALERMAEVDEVTVRLQELDATLVEREKIREVADRQLAERESEVGERLAELQEQRKEAAKGIPSEALSEFEQLVEWNEGEAMAEIIEVDRRRMEYCCGACNMSLPIEKVSALLSSGALTTCPSCGRILYVGEEIRDRFVGSR